MTINRFNIRFENGTKNNLENVQLEYVVFYEQDHHIGRNYYEKETKNGTLYKKETLSFPARENVEFVTDEILLMEWKTSTIAQIKADIEGIRLRLTLKSENGTETMREFSYPSKLKYLWTTDTENAQSRRIRN